MADEINSRPLSRGARFTKRWKKVSKREKKKKKKTKDPPSPRSQKFELLQPRVQASKKKISIIDRSIYSF